jgi:hypothetical protein
MASSDLDVLVDMGFDKERADMAVKKTGGRKFVHIYIHTYPCHPKNAIH